MDQSATNSVQLQNFVRSAIAPEISAGVMHANISWNITKARIGMASGPGHSTAATPASASAETANPTSSPAVSERPAYSRPPRRPAPTSLPKARLNPYSTHSTPTTPRAMKFIMSMLRALLLRTIPP